MKTLQQIAQSDPSWPLEELVRVVNELLPNFLPEEKSHTRVREDITPRLVRYYTSQGMLDEPLKEGREARYTYRHLLQLLLVRRLLMEGYGASAINTLAKSRTNLDLEALLQGGVQLTVTPANPALNFLQEIQQRQTHVAKSTIQTSPPPIGSSLPSTPLPSTPLQPASPASYWTRLEILSGLELHIRSDVVLPATSQEQQNLLQHILHLLLSFTTHKKRSSKS